ncbi:helix-turn-helix domain-containing protein [Streptomyces sp. NPDC059455]|uniref:helix-turn-helix domain-containing protein n=1 Tax=Streptomyces sp. NPDC059455 TaxID=3346837 RepID=UPI0036947A21
MDRVTADPAGCHTLATLAGRGGVSVRHLERLFRAEVGMAPGRYVESVRVEAAQALLADGTGTVEEVARQAGAAPRSHCAGSFSTPSRSHRRSTAPASAAPSAAGRAEGRRPTGRTANGPHRRGNGEGLTFSVARISAEESVPSDKHCIYLPPGSPPMRPMPLRHHPAVAPPEAEAPPPEGCTRGRPRPETESGSR